MSLFRTVIGRVTKTLAVVAACIYVVLMFATVIDIIRRATTGRSLEGLVEASPLLLLSAVCLGLAYAELSGTHVRTSLVTERIPRRAALVFRGTMAFLGAALLAWIGWEAVGKALEAFEFSETTIGLRPVITWPAKALVPIGFGLFALQLLFRSVDDWRALAEHKTPDHDTTLGGTA